MTNDTCTRTLRILQHCRGRDGAITARRLAAQIGATDRGVRRIVTELRRQGYPIASAVYPPHGYYWPMDESEARECQAHLYSRIRELAETARALDKAFGVHLPGRQLVLDFLGEDTCAQEA